MRQLPPSIRVTDLLDPSVAAQLDQEIDAFNMSAVGVYDGRDLFAAVRDKRDALVAGVDGRTWGGTCWIGAMGELVDELEGLGYVARRPDPTDRRAKLITLTEAGRQCVSAGINTIGDIERRIEAALGVRRHRDLRRMLLKLLAQN